MIDFLAVLGGVWILFAVIQDFRKREIANWLNFSLIIFAMIYRLFYSIYSNNYAFVISGCFGLLVFFLLANLFYYLRIFAGGDAKLMIALGALIPFSDSFYTNTLIFFIFIIALLLGGILYSLVFSTGLILRRKKEFAVGFKKQFRKGMKYVYISLTIGLILVITAIFIKENLLILLGVIIFLIPFVYFYTKAIEISCMMVYIPAKKVSEGDWLAEAIIVHGKKIKPYWEGLSGDDVEMIKKYYKKKVLIKQGIPFSPSFLIAFLVLIYINYLGGGNWSTPLGF